MVVLSSKTILVELPYVYWGILSKSRGVCLGLVGRQEFHPM